MAQPGRRRIILLAGPTASGKSAIALAWAQRLGGIVVNADSMQVYRDLRVLTARPTVEDEAVAPHRLYGHVDGVHAHSVALWLDDVAALLEREPAGQPLIFVGGTGLYLQALTTGLSPVPPVPAEVRAYWRARGLEEAPQILHAELTDRDPLMAARLRPSDPQRVLRALEVIDGTGRSLADWQSESSVPLMAHAERFLLAPERGELRRRISTRFAAMVEKGAVGEVERLVRRGLDPALPVMRAIGVPPLTAFLQGAMTLEEAIQQTVTDSRQYAKRQQTWLRNRFAHFQVLDPEHAPPGT